MQAMTNAIENVEDVMSKGTADAGELSASPVKPMTLTSPEVSSPKNTHVS
jgi:hypothetical protein